MAHGTTVHEHVLDHLREAIHKSQWIIELPHDWDGEGGKPYRVETWERARRFLLASAMWLLETLDLSLPPPDIGPGPDCGIDLHWRADSFELLLTIPDDENAPASFYGDDRGSVKVKGSTALRADGKNPLLLWVAQRLR